MPITAGKITIPAKELDKYWVHSFTVGTTGVNGQAILKASLIPYNEAGDIWQEISLDPISVFEQSAINPETQEPVDPDAAVIFGLVLSYVEKKAKEQGKLPE
jgi:hypothetical protein